MLSSSGVRIINPILTTVAQGYIQANLVGHALFPRVPVEISGGQILQFGKEAFKQYSRRRAPGAGTSRITFGYLGNPFTLLNDALEAPVPREYLRDAKVMPGIDLATRAVRLVMSSLALGLEIDQAALALTSSQYDANHQIALTGTAKWSDPTSLPITQIDTYKEAIRTSTGINPNTLLLGNPAFLALRTNPQIQNQFKYTSADSITVEMLARAFDIEKVVVGKAVTASDADVISDVWGNNAVLAYVPTAPSGLEEPSYGYTYTMTGHPLVEEPYYDNNAKSWIYGVGYERAPVLSGITSGFLIQNPK